MLASKEVQIRLATTFRAVLHSFTLILLTTPRVKSLVRLVHLLLLAMIFPYTVRLLASLVKHLTMTSSTGLVRSAPSSHSDSESDIIKRGPSGPLFYWEGI